MLLNILNALGSFHVIWFIHLHVVFLFLYTKSCPLHTTEHETKQSGKKPWYTHSNVSFFSAVLPKVFALPNPGYHF